MAFILSLIILSGMGIWVAYQLFVVRAGNAKVTGSRRPVLYWIIVAAQILFGISCLYKFLSEILAYHK